MYCYSNDGLSMRAVAEGYVAQPGEHLFADLATTEQLTAAFPEYAVGVRRIKAVQDGLDALQAGIIVISIGTSSLNGTYAADDKARANVGDVSTYILISNGVFPGGGTTMPWFDIENNPHLFPNIATFKTFATAFANYVAAVSLYIQSAGTVGSLPSNHITIP